MNYTTTNYPTFMMKDPTSRMDTLMQSFNNLSLNDDEPTAPMDWESSYDVEPMDWE